MRAKGKRKTDACYRTSDVQALYGLSNKGLFFYEDKGLISPKRTSTNQYRSYTLCETSKLHRCRMFREYGFTVDDSVMMVRECTPELLRSKLSSRKEEIFRQALRLELLMEQLDKTTRLVQQIEAGKIPYKIRMRPEMLRVALRDMGDHYTDDTSAQYKEWQNYIPFACASLCIDMNGIESGSDTLPVNLGFMIEKEYVDRLGCGLLLGSVEIPPLACLYTIVSGSDDELDEAERIRPALEWMDANGYVLNGRIITQMIATFDAGAGMKRYDKAWFPVKPGR